MNEDGDSSITHDELFDFLFKHLGFTEEKIEVLNDLILPQRKNKQ